METTTVSRRKETTDVGVRLKDILKERKMSLAALSRASGISTSALSLLTTGGIAYPRTRTISQICKALRLPPTALLPPEAVQQSDLAIADPDRPTTQGVAVVPEVRLDLADRPMDTGRAHVAEASLLNRHSRLLAASIGGGGLSPWVLSGDWVFFDPEEPPCHGCAVVIISRGTVLAAVNLVSPDGPLYRLADGQILDSSKTDLGGVIVRIFRDPPSPSALLAHARA